MTSNLRIGIDLGGTKIELVAMNATGEVLRQYRVDTPAGDYVAILNTLTSIITETETSLGQKASVGIGMPGAISPATGKVKNANSVCLNGRPFKQDLERELSRTIQIENDANCFALSEARDGAAQDASIVFGVILGTGVGGGLVINDSLISGPNAISGEWGHNPLPWASLEDLNHAADCYCTKKNCIETWLSGAGLCRTYAALTLTDEKVTAKGVAHLADEGNLAAAQALTSYYRRLAHALSGVINIIDPDVIVLGGGLSNINSLYHEVPKIWSEYVFSDSVDTRLVKAKYGDASGVRGAAWLAD